MIEIPTAPAGETPNGFGQNLANGFVAVDWGTSNFRAYLVVPEAGILEQISAPEGLLSISDRDFAGCLAKHCGAWLGARPNLPVLIAGMVGAKTAWVEAPYGHCPAAAEDLSGLVVDVPNDLGTRIRILPGLSCRDAHGAPDIMRGEETMLMGLLAGEPGFDGLVILPGTHSKHARLAQGRIQGFQTQMSGEIFDLLRRQSILRLTMDFDRQDQIADNAAFSDGVHLIASEPENLLHHLFTVRSRAIIDGLGDKDSGAFLSGLLIGMELAAVPGRIAGSTSKVVVLGAPILAALYQKALAVLGTESQSYDPQTCLLAGLRAIAK